MKSCERCGIKIDTNNPEIVYVRLSTVRGLKEANHYICIDCGNRLFATPEAGTEIK